MEALGLLAELSTVDGSSLPSLRDLKGRMDPSKKARAIDYLRNGVTVLDVMEATPDPPGPGSYVPGGSSLITDGHWVWRLDLANYVEAYNMALPEAFLASAMKGAPNSSLSLSEDLIAEALAAHGWANP